MYYINLYIIIYEIKSLFYNINMFNFDLFQIYKLLFLLNETYFFNIRDCLT
jgi:hypothetical protein